MNFFFSTKLFKVQNIDYKNTTMCEYPSLELKVHDLWSCDNRIFGTIDYEREKFEHQIAYFKV